MQVKYAKWFPITALIVGGLLLLINIFLMGSGAVRPTSLVPVIILPLVGGLGLINPMYVYKEGELQARNLLGMTLFRHKRENISFEDGKRPGETLLFVTKKNGKRKRIMSTHSFLMDRKQATALVDSLRVQETF